MPRFLPTFLGACVLGFSIGATGEAERTEAGEPKIVRVERIWDRSPHNAFTDLVRYGDQWFCVFREGSSHVSKDGSLRVIRSRDGWNWESAALLTHPAADLRDAKITVTPQGKLMLSGAGAMHPPSPNAHESMVWFSENGTDWTEPTVVADPDHWLWRVTWNGPVAYGLGYRTGPTQDRYVRLYASDDGLRFKTLVPRLFDDGYPNESSLHFTPDGECLCLLRRDGSDDATAMLGRSVPPYQDWSWKDLGVRIGGPHWLQVPDGRLIAAVRLLDPPRRTALCEIDPEQGSLVERLALPSGGDTSYAGMVWHDGHLWVSYYSEHESKETGVKTSIYLAQIALD